MILARWLALFAGFSPVLFEFARFEAWYAPPSTLVAPVLIAVCLWKGPRTADPPRRAGIALIGAGLLLELIGIALRTWTLAWLGFPVAVLGMALWLGYPSWRVAVLAFGLIAIPESLRAAFSPGPESTLLAGACALWRAAGVPFSCTGPVARIGGRHLELIADDVGVMLAVLLAQLGWFLALREGASLQRAVYRALAFAASALVIQPLAIVLALGLLAVGSEEMARVWLSFGLWLGCALGVVLWSWRRRPA